MSFHNYKPGFEQTDPPPPATRVYHVILRRTFEWDFTVRAGSDEAAILEAQSVAEPINSSYSEWVDTLATAYDDHGQEVDLEVEP